MISRGRAQKTILDAIQNGKNIFLCGPRGAGKTFILRSVLNGIEGEKVLYSQDSTTLKRSLCGFLSSAQKGTSFSSMNILSLKKLFYKTIKEKKPYLIFDHLGRVGPKFLSFFENLINEYPMLIVAENSNPKTVGNLSMFLCLFDELLINNFSRQDSFALIDRFIEEFNIAIKDRAGFKKGVFAASKGNPQIIKELCFLAIDKKYHKSGVVDVGLLDLDRKIRDVINVY